MPAIKKCEKCGTYMKRGPLTAERDGKAIVLTKYKLFDCQKCGYNEVVEVKKERQK